MILIDTHTHLFLPEFDSDRSEVIESAIARGVEKMLLPNIDSGSYEAMMKVCSGFKSNCLPMIGLHPSSVKDDYKTELKFVEEKISQQKFWAIGETGIDLYWDKTFFEQQQEAFEFQLNLAKKHHLPLVIHARESFSEIFEIVEANMDDRLTGVFHSFTGNEEQAKKITGWGFKVGIGGIVTFKNSGLDAVVKNIDLDHIVLETDSPYLAPTPKRGKRNESKYLQFIADKIASVKGVDVEYVAEVTTYNARKLFSID